MLTLYDHIQELRAELRGCVMTHKERARAEVELAHALVQQAELDDMLEVVLFAEPRNATRTLHPRP